MESIILWQRLRAVEHVKPVSKQSLSSLTHSVICQVMISLLKLRSLCKQRETKEDLRRIAECPEYLFVLFKWSIAEALSGFFRS